MWALRHPRRYLDEQRTLRELAERCEWLEVREWRWDNGRFCVDIELTVHGVLRRAVLQYSEGFPHSPPVIYPKTAEHWSGHQYGTADLCLEYRGDNWVPTLTGADLVESAYRLLEAEARTEERPNPPPVPSSHEMSLGQTMRSQHLRLVLTADARRILHDVTDECDAEFSSMLHQDASATFLLQSMARGDAERWSSSELPAKIGSGTTPGTVLRAAVLFVSSKAREVRLHYRPHAEVPDDLNEIIVAILPDSLAAFWLYKDKAHSLGLIEADAASRLADAWLTQMDEKRVAVVGCGSVGSKIAAMLVRSGVRRLLLIDDDIVKPENLVRNELSWRDVGAHKAHALAQRLRTLRNGLDITVKLQALGGQEASSDTDSTLFALAACDLIVDASADDKAFNYAAAMAQQHGKPMVWGQIFGGGFGGIIARSRPALDPAPHFARAAIDAWFQKQPPTPGVLARPYESDGSAHPWIADDADVSLVASHLARLALDTLRQPATATDYPVSAYVFATRPAGGIFEQPFLAHSLDLGPAADTWSTEVADDESRQEVIDDLVRMLSKSDDKSSTES